MKLLNLSLSIAKKIIFLLLGILMLLTILGVDVDVFAASQIDWGYEKELPLKAFFYGSNGAEITGGFITNTNYMQSSNDLTNAYIRIISNTGEQFKKDYLYNIQFYFCTSRDPGSFAGYTFRFKTTYNDVSSVNNYSWSSTNIFTLSSPFLNGVSGDTKVDRMNYCYYTTSLAVPSQNLNYVEMGITTSARLGYFSLIGVEVQELGVFTEALKVIVETAITTSNTDLKADVIDNANQNKQEIIDNQNKNTEQQIENENKNHKETMDTITDDTPPDNDSTNNFVSGSAGWLPAGPLDTILNLPLTLFNTWLDALSHKCTPVKVTFPYVDTDFSLTCPGDLVKQINGVDTLLNFIGAIVSAFMLYNYLLHLYEWTDRVSKLEDMKVPGYYSEP